MVENDLTKEEILKDLILNKEDTLKKLKELVEKSKEFIMIEGNTGKIVFLKSNLALKDKIIVLLIGRYFAKETGLSNSEKFNFDNIRGELSVESRALSRPLGDLIRDNIIEKEGDDYYIKYYQIENSLDKIKETKKAESTTKYRKRERKTKKEIEKKEEKNLIEGSIQKFANRLQISDDELKHVLEFDKNDVRIISLVEGKSEGDRQLKATLIYLTVYKHCYGLNEIDSTELRNKLRDLGIHSLVNLSTNLKQHHALIWHRTSERGDTNTSYRITTPGEMKGLNIIKEINKKVKEKIGETGNETAI